MRAPRIMEMIYEAPTLSHLVEPIENENEIPSSDSVKEVWLYLTRRLIPSIAESRSSKFPEHLRDFKRAQTLALAARINDFNLKDFGDPTKERWIAQLNKLETFAAFCHLLNERVRAELHEMMEARVKLDRVSANLESRQQALKALEEYARERQADPQQTESVNERASLEAVLEEKQSLLDRLKSTMNRNLEPRETELNRQLERLDERITLLTSQVEVLKPVATRGLAAVRSESQNLESQVTQLEDEIGKQEEMVKRYTSTLQVFTQLKQDLDELAQLKKDVLSAQTRRGIFDGNTVSKTRQRRDQLAHDHQLRTQQDQQLTARLTSLTASLDTQRKKLEELQSSEKKKEKSDAVDPDPDQAESSVQTLQAKVEQLTQENKELALTIKSQQNWLQGMEAMAIQGEKLEQELEILKQWMKNYLEESKN